MQSKIKRLIDDSKSILLLTHESPDGDAIGSVLSFYHYLTSINKSVDMIMLNMPKVYDFLPSIDKVVDNTDKDYDLGIVLDCSSRERIAQLTDSFSRCKNTICIDHHISNTNYCDLNFIEGNISSCCQVVYYLFKNWNISISQQIGESLISGVITDTNGFGNDDVDTNTFKMVSELMDLGVDIHYIYSKLLLIKTIPQYNLMKIGMERLEFFCDGKICFTYILENDFKTVGATTGEHEGIVDIGRNIEGVEISIFLRENEGWSVSLRSSGTFPVNEIAYAIGGGGHFLAAGGKMNGPLKDVKDYLISEAEKVILEK